jgi:hypothetical protein
MPTHSFARSIGRRRTLPLRFHALLRGGLLTLIGVGALANAGTVQARTVIATTGFWTGGFRGNICAFAKPFYATVGQVVTVPARDSLLESFTFYMSDFRPVPGATLTFRGEVYAWDGTKATGPNIWESTPQTLTLDPAFREVTLVPGDIALLAGHQYILFASLSKDYERNADEARSCWGVLGRDVYDGGGSVFLDDRGDESAWTQIPWLTGADDFGGVGDFAFKAAFRARLPTSKDQCRIGGWRQYAVFKNQGDCVSFVATGGRNAPANSQP